LTDVPQRIQEHKKIIIQVDKPERQVLIEARLVDMKTDAIRGLGMNLTLSNEDSSGNSPAQWNGLPVEQLLLAYADPAAATQFAFGDNVGIFGNDVDISGLLTMFEQRDLVETLANPRVMTLNNVAADIEMIEQVPWSEIGESQTGNATEDIQTEEIGIKITVTPSITPNNFVRLNLLTEQTINNGRVPGSGALGPLLVDERNANTNVIVKTDETVLLGGLRQMRISDQTEGTPWFHRIPVLGWLFKNKANSQNKTELFLFVTPHVLENPTLTTNEKSMYDRIDLKWDLPDYFFDDVKIDEDMD
jgi:type IV pilus assembly protein PilQ